MKNFSTLNEKFGTGFWGFWGWAKSKGSKKGVFPKTFTFPRLDPCWHQYCLLLKSLKLSSHPSEFLRGKNRR